MVDLIVQVTGADLLGEAFKVEEVVPEGERPLSNDQPPLGQPGAKVHILGDHHPSVLCAVLELLLIRDLHASAAHFQGRHGINTALPEFLSDLRSVDDVFVQVVSEAAHGAWMPPRDPASVPLREPCPRLPVG